MTSFDIAKYFGWSIDEVENLSVNKRNKIIAYVNKRVQQSQPIPHGRRRI
jgi:hypothetical protein